MKNISFIHCCLSYHSYRKWRACRRTKTGFELFYTASIYWNRFLPWRSTFSCSHISWYNKPDESCINIWAKLLMVERQSSWHVPQNPRRVQPHSKQVPGLSPSQRVFLWSWHVLPQSKTVYFRCHKLWGCSSGCLFCYGLGPVLSPSENSIGSWDPG